MITFKCHLATVKPRLSQAKAETAQVSSFSFRLGLVDLFD